VPAKSADELDVICIGDIEPLPVEWLWEKRFPRGMLSLLVGPPGCGKTLVSNDMSARCTKGQHWPDASGKAPVGEVIVLASEDSLPHTIRPRLDAAGADVQKIFCVRGVVTYDQKKEKSSRAIRFDIDMARLEALMVEHPECVVIVVDPLPEFLGNVDSHKNDQVRAVLGRLAVFAENHNVAVLGITHFSKGNGGRALFRAIGSLAFVAVARSVWACIPDSEDENRTFFLPVKCNLSERASGLAYSIRDGVVEWEEDEVTISADEAMKRSEQGQGGGKVDEAVAWLQERLKDGQPVESEALKTEAKAAGFSFATFKRAKTKAGCRHDKGCGSKTSKWYVSLPLPAQPSTIIIEQPEVVDALKRHGALDEPLGKVETLEPFERVVSQDAQEDQVVQLSQQSQLAQLNGRHIQDDWTGIIDRARGA
jgi:hypothetical protein